MENNKQNKIWTDNTQIKAIPSLKGIDEVLRILTSQTIGELAKKYKKFLIFPERLSPKTADSKILDGYYNNENSFYLRTTNIMGVISYFDEREHKEPITISIGSRFDSSEKQIFFVYLLSHVFDFNIVDWKPQTGEIELWDLLLVFLFIYHLEKAYRQGLFKQYVLRRYNEYNFKGALDAQRHINENIPFTGRVAYKFKEMSYDNPVLHLIRYTTDYVHSKYGNLWRGLLTNKWVVNEAVRVIREATPSYTPQSRLKIYHTSLKPIRHPFYTEYETLRKICMRLLRNEGLNVYEGTGDRIYGVLFDGAWLWERYIAKLLKPLGFKHFVFPDDKEIFAFEKNSGPYYYLYPDFYNEGRRLVFDAKYKRWDEKDEEDKRGDYHQILAYMYVTLAEAGGIIFPKQTEETIDKSIGINYMRVRNVGKPFYEIAFHIPKTDDGKFRKEIGDNEKDFVERLQSILHSDEKGLNSTGRE